MGYFGTDIRIGHSGGVRDASGGATVTAWQVTAGAYALWVDFNVFTLTSGDFIYYKPQSTGFTLTSSTAATLHLSETGRTFDSGVTITSGYVSAATAGIDAPVIYGSPAISSDWRRLFYIAPNRVLSLWRRSDNTGFGCAIQLCEVRTPDNGMSFFLPKMSVFR